LFEFFIFFFSFLILLKAFAFYEDELKADDKTDRYGKSQRPTENTPADDGIDDLVSLFHKNVEPLLGSFHSRNLLFVFLMKIDIFRGFFIYVSDYSTNFGNCQLF